MPSKEIDALIKEAPNADRASRSHQTKPQSGFKAERPRKRKDTFKKLQEIQYMWSRALPEGKMAAENGRAKPDRHRMCQTKDLALYPESWKEI